VRALDFPVLSVPGFVPYYKDAANNALAINAVMYKDRFAAATLRFEGAAGVYDVTITALLETDGEATYRLRVNGAVAGEAQNPPTAKDYVEAPHLFRRVALRPGDTIQVESNTHSNRKIPEGAAFAYARGRWRALSLASAASETRPP
jgi:hypothetical protein